LKPAEFLKRAIAYLKELRYMILQDSLVPKRIGRRKGRPRVFLLGLDGAEPSLVLDNPQLPNLQALARRGTHGELVSVNPPITAPAWTSLFTGKKPSKHGVLDFQLPLKCENCGREPARWEFYNECPECGTHVEKRLISAQDVHGRRLWGILAQENLTSGLLNVPVTWSNPLLPVNGWQISGMMTPGLHASYSYPAYIKPRHLRGYKLDVLGQDAHIDKRINSHELRLDVERVHRVAKTVIHNRRTFLRKMMTLYPTDFTFAVFTASDRLQHVTWHRQDLILDFWRELDSITAEIHEFVTKDGYTHFFVVSDHGFCDVNSPEAQHHLRRCGKPGINHYGVHRLEGTYIAIGEGIKANQRLDGVSIMDIAPTVLNLYGLPIPADMDGRLVAAFFQDGRAEQRAHVGETQQESDTKDEQYSAEEASEVENRLRGLGYIE